MSETPQTDFAQFGTGLVSVDFARRLERERDIANEKLHEKIIQFDKLFDVAVRMRIERDEALKELEGFKNYTK
jgi:hypothetical protein